MPTTQNGTVAGFEGAIKMLTLSDDRGSYEGFNVEEDNSYYFVRSYVHAKDYLYEGSDIINSVGADLTIETGTDASSNSHTAILHFAKKGTYTFVVKNGKLTITSFAINDFFKLNDLDITNASTQNAVKNQKTTIVLEVKVAILNTAEVQLRLVPTATTLSTYAGYSFLVTTDKIANLHETDPVSYPTASAWDHMRA